MADKVQFDLVSPEKILVSQAVDMVVVPGSEGDFGVLPGHSPLMALLRPGVITTYEGAQATQKIFVASGFAEVNPAGVIVLAEAADELGQLTLDKVRQELADAEEDLQTAKSPSDSERTRLEEAVTVARARVEALSTA